MNKKITISIIFISLLAVVVLVMTQLNKREPRVLITEEDEGQLTIIPPKDGVASISDLTEYKTYKNEEVGISFIYPDIFQRVDARVSNGETGKKFSGILEFEPSHSISFGGVTSDYSAPRGGGIEDTLGYTKDGDQYVVKFIWDNYQVVTVEMWDTGDLHTQALVMSDTEIGHIINAEGFAVFVNIPNSKFTGIVFTPSSHDPEEVKILQKIISSITFN